MTDLIELLRNRNEHVAQRAADELERKDAAIAELVGALTWCESIMTQLEATGMVHLEPHVPKHVRMIDKVRVAITKHQQPTTKE